MVAFAFAAMLAASLQDPDAFTADTAGAALPPEAEAAAREGSLPSADPAPARESSRIVPAAPERPASRKLEDRPEAGPGLGGFLLWSCVVMALLAGTFVALRRLTRRSRFFAGGGAIHVLARKPLGQKQEIFLVSAGPKVFMVGSTRDRLSTLGEFSNPDEVASLRASLEGERGESAGAQFRASLREGLRGGEKETDGREAYASIAEEIAGIRAMVRGWRV